MSHNYHHSDYLDNHQKSHEIQLVDVPTDAEVIVTNPIENADTSEEENYFIEHTSNVSNSTAANL